MTKQLVVVLAIVRDRAGRYLLGRRNSPEMVSMHGKWDIPGGKLEYGETPEEAVVREVKEESGLDAKVVAMLPCASLRYREKSDGTKLQIIGLPFLCTTEQQESDLQINDPKVDELAFVLPLEIESFAVSIEDKEMLYQAFEYWTHGVKKAMIFPCEV